MNLLAFETTTSKASVTVQNTQGKRSSRSSDNPKSHSEFLNLAIHECLLECQIELKDLKRILTTNGPGSFTGIRVGISAAKSLGYSLGTTIKVTNSLTVLHQMSKSLNQAVLLNAQKNMVFASFKILGKIWPEPRLISVSEVEQLIFDNFDSKATIEPVGLGHLDYSGFWSERLLSRLTPEKPEILYPTAEALINISQTAPELFKTFEWKLLNPLYLRASAAEEKKREAQIERAQVKTDEG